jgi:hypothetical protein
MTAVHAAVLVRFEDGRDAFFLGRVDEGAGIDDHHVGFVGVGREGHARQVEMAGDDFGIDEVLRAAERDQPDLETGGGGGEEGAHGWCDSTVKVSGSEWSLCGP